MNNSKKEFFSLNKFYLRWKERYASHLFSTMDRGPYFDIAGRYLPKDEKAAVVDIGAGDGSFADHLRLKEKYKNLFLLDGSSYSINRLKGKYNNATLYEASSELPFKSNEVEYIHASHLIEHLSPDDLYSFLKEIDRVLKKEGVLIISSPMLWDGFYDDLTHKKPYNPEAIIHYLCLDSENRSKDHFPSKYEVSEIRYRYTTKQDECLGSAIKILDFIMFTSGRFCKKIFKINKYKKNGYTLVLRKK